MSESNNTEPAATKIVSTDNRGGQWLPIVLAAMGGGVVLSGIFSGSIGLYGDSGTVTFADGVQESVRESIRFVIFSLLLLGALRVHCWRMQRPLGNLFLASLRCLAVIALIEAVRVAQIPHGLIRVLLIVVAQYIVCAVGLLILFTMTIRETVLFVSWCTVGAGLLWVGAYVGMWIA